MADRLLLADGTSLLFLADGASYLLLADQTTETLAAPIVEVVPAALQEAEVVGLSLFVDVVPGGLREASPTSPSYYTGGKAPRWRIRVVGLATASYVGYGEFPSAVPTWTDTLNDLSEARVTVSTSDPAYQYLGDAFTFNRLIEVWLDGDLKMRGWAVRGPVDKAAQTCTFQVFDELWPIRQRVFGRADRVNLVTNGGFETSASSFAPWAQSGAGTTTIDTTTVNEGSRSLKMVGGGTGGTYVYQAFVVNHTYPPGLVVRLSAWFNIPTGMASPDGNLAGVIKVTDPTLASNPYYYGFTIDDDADRNGWDRRYVDALLSKANTDYLVEVRLYGTSATIYWDSVQVVFNDATTVAFPGEDQSVMFRKIVEYAQDPAQGKSNLGLATNCATTGDTIMVGYAHADHRSIYDALTELSARPTGADFSLVYTPALTTFTTHYPDKGDTHAEWRLEEGRNLIAPVYEIDNTQVATSVIVLGDTPDFAREEGGAVDTSSTSLILERVVRAQPNTPVGFLDELASEMVDQAKQPVIIVRGPVMDPDRELIHGVEVGDVLPVRVETGMTALDGVSNYRVVRKTVPASADRLNLDLVPVPV